MKLNWIEQIYQVKRTRLGWLVWIKSPCEPKLKGFSETSADLAIKDYQKQFRRYLASKA